MHYATPPRREILLEKRGKSLKECVEYNRFFSKKEFPDMKIELNLYASLARCIPREVGAPYYRIWEVDEGTTILALLHRLQVPMDKVKLIFLNGLHAHGDEILREGDRVGVFPGVAGG
jgi:molybdopterin synthase sulfur carrier subunit